MVHTVSIEKLTVKAFSPYGQAILGSKGTANYTGEGWSSLFPAGKAHVPKGEIGWVKTTQPSGGMVVTGMEREPEVEIVWTVKESIIQAVSLPGDLSNHAEQPDVNDVRAFIIVPGQVIIMHPGTWHCAAFSADPNKEALYYFLTRDHPREPGWEDVAWIPFRGDLRVKIVSSDKKKTK